MNEADTRRDYASIIRALIVGGATVAAAAVVARAVVKSFEIKHQEQRVTVTGSASRRIRSDLIVWRAHLRAQNPDLTAAYKKLAADVPVAVAFIRAGGVTDQELTVSAASITEVHPRSTEGAVQEEVIASYLAEQDIVLESSDIPKVERISREATQLLDRGVYIQSDAPLYVYTKLGPLKIQMLAEASKDARLRAEQIATNTGAHLGKLLTARMGVMQVNPKFSSDVSGEGNNDKTAFEKDALAVVTASFEVR
ncbi:MAG: SIMPL domain-containing protein [Polyangiaceae bacterium]